MYMLAILAKSMCSYVLSVDVSYKIACMYVFGLLSSQNREARPFVAIHNFRLAKVVPRLTNLVLLGPVLARWDHFWQLKLVWCHWARVKFPRDLEPPHCFVIPYRTGNLASPRQIYLSFNCYGTLMLQYSTTINWNNLLQFHCSPSAGHCCRPTHLRWYQSPHVSHSTILSYVSGI